MDPALDIEGGHDPFDDSYSDEDEAIHQDNQNKEAPNVDASLFNPRLAFIRKVYGILSV